MRGFVTSRPGSVNEPLTVNEPLHATGKNLRRLLQSMPPGERARFAAALALGERTLADLLPARAVRLLFGPSRSMATTAHGRRSRPLPKRRLLTSEDTRP
jgi:hypothetical protein